MKNIDSSNLPGAALAQTKKWNGEYRPSVGDRCRLHGDDLTITAEGRVWFLVIDDGKPDRQEYRVAKDARFEPIFSEREEFILWAKACTAGIGTQYRLYGKLYDAGMRKPV